MSECGCCISAVEGRTRWARRAEVWPGGSRLPEAAAEAAAEAAVGDSRDDGWLPTLAPPSRLPRGILKGDGSAPVLRPQAPLPPPPPPGPNGDAAAAAAVDMTEAAEAHMKSTTPLTWVRRHVIGGHASVDLCGGRV